MKTAFISTIILLTVFFGGLAIGLSESAMYVALALLILAGGVYYLSPLKAQFPKQKKNSPRPVHLAHETSGLPHPTIRSRRYDGPYPHSGQR
jgi:hypothetical protein